MGQVRPWCGRGLVRRGRVRRRRRRQPDRGFSGHLRRFRFRHRRGFLGRLHHRCTHGLDSPNHFAEARQIQGFAAHVDRITRSRQEGRVDRRRHVRQDGASILDPQVGILDAFLAHRGQGIQDLLGIRGSCLGVLGQQVCNQLFVWVDPRHPGLDEVHGQRLFIDLTLDRGQRVRRHERRLPADHLVHQDAQGIEVRSRGPRIARTHLGGHVLGGPGKRFVAPRRGIPRQQHGQPVSPDPHTRGPVLEQDVNARRAQIEMVHPDSRGSQQGCGQGIGHGHRFGNGQALALRDQGLERGPRTGLGHHVSFLVCRNPDLDGAQNARLSRGREPPSQVHQRGQDGRFQPSRARHERQRHRGVIGPAPPRRMFPVLVLAGLCIEVVSRRELWSEHDVHSTLARRAR